MEKITINDKEVQQKTAESSEEQENPQLRVMKILQVCAAERKRLKKALGDDIISQSQYDRAVISLEEAKLLKIMNIE